MSGGCFHTLKLTEFLGAIEEFHGRVSQERGRIEITRDGCDDVCVLISKSELEALERALEILSETSDFRSMCQTLASVVAQAHFSPASQTA